MDNKNQIKKLLQIFNKDSEAPVVEQKSSDLLQEDSRSDSSTKFLGKVYHDPETTEAKQVPGDQVRGTEGPGPFSHYKGKQHPFKGRLVGGESEENNEEALEEIDNGPRGTYREPGVTYDKNRNMSGTYVSKDDLAARRKEAEDKKYWANLKKEREQRERERTNPGRIIQKLAKMGEPMVSDWYHGGSDDPYESVRTGLIDMANDEGIHWDTKILDSVMKKWGLRPGMVREDGFDILEAQMKAAFEDYIAKKDSKKDKGLQSKEEKKVKSDDKEEKSDVIKEAEGEGASIESIVHAISHRIMHQQPQLLRQYGLGAVTEAIRSVAEFHQGAEELGSSDISIMVKEVMRDLERHPIEEDWGEAHGDEDEIAAERYSRKRDRDEYRADHYAPVDDEWPNPWAGTKDIPAVNEGKDKTVYDNAIIIKTKKGRTVGEIYPDGQGTWGFFHYARDFGADSIDTKQEAYEGLKEFHDDYLRDRGSNAVSNFKDLGEDEHRRFYPGSKGVLAKQTHRLAAILEDMKKLDAEGKLDPQMVQKFKSLLGMVELQAQSLPEAMEAGKEIIEATEWSPSTPYGLRYRVFAGKEKRLTTVDKWFATSQALSKAEEKIKNSDNFYEIVGHSYPEIKEGKISRFLKGVKRGLTGWEKGVGTPKELVARNKNLPTDTMKSLASFDKDHKSTPHSPQDLQRKVLDRELKRREKSLNKAVEWNPPEETAESRGHKIIAAKLKDIEARKARDKANEPKITDTPESRAEYQKYVEQCEALHKPHISFGSWLLYNGGKFESVIDESNYSEDQKINDMIQQVEDMSERIFQMVPGKKMREAVRIRDEMEEKISQMPGGEEALEKWGRAYNDSFDESKVGEDVVDASDKFKQKRAEDEAERLVRVGDKFWKDRDAAKDEGKKKEVKEGRKPSTEQIRKLADKLDRVKALLSKIKGKEIEEDLIPVGAPGKNIPVAGTSPAMPGQEDGAAPVPGQPVAPAQQAPAPKGLPTVPSTPGQPVPPTAGQPGGAPVAQKTGSPAPASGSAANASTTPLETVKTAFTQLAQPGAQQAAQKVAAALKNVK